MSQQKKIEKERRRFARAKQHVLSAMGVFSRQNAVQREAILRQAEIVAAVQALDWRNPNVLLEAPKVAKGVLERAGVDVTWIDMVIGKDGGIVSVGARPSVEAEKEAERRLEKRARVTA